MVFVSCINLEAKIMVFLYKQVFFRFPWEYIDKKRRPFGLLFRTNIQLSYFTMNF